MEKTITIDKKKVKLKSTAGTPIRYKAQFRKDYFAELFKLAKLFSPKKKGDEVPAEDTTGDTFDLDAISFEELNYLDFEVIYNFVWVLAKSADSTIPEPLEWLDQFEVFPLDEIFPEVSKLLAHSISSKKK